MKHDDKKIAHLENLGRTRSIAIAKLEEKLEVDPGTLDIAEITDSQMRQNKELLIAGVCGEREPEYKGDMGENIYSLVCFRNLRRIGKTFEHTGIFIPYSLQDIVDYRLLKE